MQALYLVFSIIHNTAQDSFYSRRAWYVVHALHTVAVLSLKWWTFLCFCIMETSGDQPIKLMINNGVSRKIVSCHVHEFANIHHMIRRAFQPTIILAHGFTIQFLHWDFNDYVDFDSPIQLKDQKNDELIVICNNSANNMKIPLEMVIGRQTDERLRTWSILFMAFIFNFPFICY